nr:Mu transposase C-terminal domain-containing protein [Rheinheimera soli]
MPTDLPAIPLKLWNWGIANRTGVLRRVDQKTVTVNLLPHEKATVSVNGINFKGLFYTCEEALRLGWFHRNKANARPNNVQVAYNTLDTNTIYLRPDNQFENYWVCTLHPRSRRYENMTFIEAASILKESNQTTAIYKQEEDYIAPDLQVEIEKIVQQATDRQKRTKFSKKTHRLQGIGENRDNERNLERNKNRIEQTTQSEVKHVATVTTIHSDKHSKQDFSYPDLDDF